MANQYKFKVKREISPRLIMSLVAAFFGVISLIFMAAPGIVLKYANTALGTADPRLWSLTWGGGDYVASMSAGLIIAFFLVIVGILVDFGISGFHFVGYLSFLIYVASAVLFFCVIPLSTMTISIIGSGSTYVGWGTYASAGSQLVAAVLSLLAARGD